MTRSVLARALCCGANGVVYMKCGKADQRRRKAEPRRGPAPLTDCSRRFSRQGGVELETRIITSLTSLSLVPGHNVGMTKGVEPPMLPDLTGCPGSVITVLMLSPSKEGSHWAAAQPADHQKEKPYRLPRSNLPSWRSLLDPE
ncbi:hypothetical protein CRENBAI_002821 [Crenichthys baileyi]|uniref:Uncharacterized protein n=1 Tax=Crenichthys baileyi TaxID=28760 RepID=A0AAV9RNP0_9TELE